MKRWFVIFILLGVFLSGITGCATKRYVNSRIDNALDSEISAIRGEIEAKEEKIENVQKEIGVIRQDIESNKIEITNELTRLKDLTEQQKIDLKNEIAAKERGIVQDAMTRAEETGKLKKAKLLYEVTISEESVPFAYKKSELSDDAKAALDTFADLLIKENKAVYIEIQGHTDDIGSENYNLKLGEQRADSVMRYLHISRNIPLNHISTFSYGESKPAVLNDGETNRSKNRRVVLMVME